MKKSKHLSEEDFQNYIENSSTTDLKLFNEHIRVCEQCRESFQAYSSVWSFVRNDYKIETLRIDLASTVAGKVFLKKRSNPVSVVILFVTLLLLGTISAFLYFKFIIVQSVPVLFVGLFAIPLIFYFWLSLKEMNIIRNKFAIYL
jgi:hypothetical protein